MSIIIHLIEIIGKLCVIMGAHKSGKSTLLQVLAGVPVSASTRVTGTMHLDDAPHATSSKKPWQLCGYVGPIDELFEDLTVSEIVTYAMQLRCQNFEDLDLIDENVKATLDLLQLDR